MRFKNWAVKVNLYGMCWAVLDHADCCKAIFTSKADAMAWTALTKGWYVQAVNLND